MYEKNDYIFLPFIASNLMGIPSHLDKKRQDLLQKLIDYNGPKIFLLSYPCSGNTWTRYCLEYLTQRPSFHYWTVDLINLPLGCYGNFELDFNKIPIEKAHRLEPGTFDKDIDQLILISRISLE